jgi:hypothetical protein
MDGMFDGARYIIRMTVPGEVLEHNGTTQIGSRIEWNFQDSDLTDGTMPEVLTASWNDSGYASGTPGVGGSGSTSLLFIGGAIIAALIGVGLFVVGRNKASEPVVAAATDLPASFDPRGAVGAESVGRGDSVDPTRLS